jgi:hypothetical protein
MGLAFGPAIGMLFGVMITSVRSSDEEGDESSGDAT